MDYYIAYPVSEELSQDLDKFIQQMREPKPKKAPELLVSVLALNNDETIDAFLLDLLSSAGLKGKQVDRIEKGVAAIKKARSVVTPIIKKLDVKKSITIAEHFESCRLEGEGGTDFSASPISHDFYRKVLDENNRIREGGLEHGRDAFISNLKEVVRESMEYFNYGLLEAIGTGPIVKRAIKAAMDATLKLVFSTYDNVFKQATEEEILKAMEHLENMLIVRE